MQRTEITQENPLHTALWSEINNMLFRYCARDLLTQRSGSSLSFLLLVSKVHIILFEKNCFCGTLAPRLMSFVSHMHTHNRWDAQVHLPEKWWTLKPRQARHSELYCGTVWHWPSCIPLNVVRTSSTSFTSAYFYLSPWQAKTKISISAHFPVTV